MADFVHTLLRQERGLVWITAWLIKYSSYPRYETAPLWNIPRYPSLLECFEPHLFISALLLPLTPCEIPPSRNILYNTAL